jgi:outer membrane protein OmpA-like peptidoglycan-associated protein
MRKWCATMAMGVLFALPLCAQQKDVSTASKGNETSESTAVSSSTAGSTAGEFNVAPASRSLFAMPAAAGASPADIYTDWANNPWNRHAWGLLTPKWEIAGMFQYVNFSPGTGFNNANSYGASGSFAYNANKWLGLTGEVGSYAFSRKVLVTNGTAQQIATLNGNFQTYLFGPRVNIRHFDHFVPFAEFLFGGAHGTAQVTGNTSQSVFALAAGGGVDVILMKNLAWRFFEADYLMTNFSGPLLAPVARQNNFRIGSGMVLRWGYPPEPPKPIHPPTASCSADKSSIYEGSTDPVGIHVAATDVDKVGLTFSYTATGGTVDGTGPDVRWIPTGLAIGTYTINAKVDNNHGGTATCSASVTVAQRPNRPPVISCAPERSPILTGEHVTIKSTASDPDGDPLTYSYSATGGQVSGTGPTAQFDATGLKAGNYTITCTADDGRGGRTSATTTVEVKDIARKLTLHDVFFPTNLPTKAKPNGGLLASQEGTLNTLASDFKEYLTYKPDAHLLLEGHADIRGPKEFNQKLSERRAERVKNYLVEHGVPADHLDTRAYGEEKNLSKDEVQKIVEDNPELSSDIKQKLIKEIATVALALNRRVDIALIGKGGQEIERPVRAYPFNAEDALTLLSRSGEETKKPAAKPAPKKTPKP